MALGSLWTKELPIPPRTGAALRHAVVISQHHEGAVGISVERHAPTFLTWVQQLLISSHGVRASVPSPLAAIHEDSVCGWLLLNPWFKRPAAETYAGTYTLYRPSAPSRRRPGYRKKPPSRGCFTF